MENIDRETFGKRVYRLRSKLGLSQGQLAKKIGSSHGSIQNYEKNSLPKGEYAIKLADVFGCSIDYLLTGKDIKLENASGQSSSPKKEIDPEELKKILAEHQDLIKKYRDPEAGKEVNEILLEIELLSEKDFHRCIGYLEAKLQFLKEKYSVKNTPENGDDIPQKKIS